MGKPKHNGLYGPQGLCVALRVFLLFLMVQPTWALEPEPRKWNHLPLDTNFGGLTYVYGEADISTDPALQLEDVELTMRTWVAKYIRSFEALGKSARVDVTQAYQEGRWTGLVAGTPSSATRSGMADTFVRFAVNLYGAPPLAGRDYAAYKAHESSETIVGVGLAIRLPTGSYMNDKLINLGQNRYAFRPQIGVLHTRGKWTSELTGEVAFYTDNDDFFNGSRLEQEPLYIVHGHLIYTFRPGLWAGVSLAYDYGGETRVDGVNKDDRRQNTAFALSMAYPLSRSLGLNFSYINAETREATGDDSERLVAGIAYMW